MRVLLEIFFNCHLIRCIWFLNFFALRNRHIQFLLKDIAGEVIMFLDLRITFQSSLCSKDDKNYDAIVSFNNGLKASIQSLNLKDYDIFDILYIWIKG